MTMICAELAARDRAASAARDMADVLEGHALLKSYDPFREYTPTEERQMGFVTAARDRDRARRREESTLERDASFATECVEAEEEDIKRSERWRTA